MCDIHLGPGARFTNVDSQHGQVATCPVTCGMKLLIHSQTSTVDVWEWISNFIPHFIIDVNVNLIKITNIHQTRFYRQCSWITVERLHWQPQTTLFKYFAYRFKRVDIFGEFIIIICWNRTFIATGLLWFPIIYILSPQFLNHSRGPLTW